MTETPKSTPKPPPEPEKPKERPMVTGTPPMTAEERARIKPIEVRVPKRRTRR